MGHIRFVTRNRIFIAAALGVLSTAAMTLVLPAMALQRKWVVPENVPQSIRTGLVEVSKPYHSARTWLSDWYTQRMPRPGYPDYDNHPGEGPRTGLKDEGGKQLDKVFTGPLDVIITYEAGWPFRAASATMYSYYATPREPYKASMPRMYHKWEWAVVVSDKNRWAQVVVPLRPEWFGLAGNIGVHTLAWLTCVGLVGAAADWRRRLPGCCRACGYELAGLPAGSPCPECGRSDERRVTRDG